MSNEKWWVGYPWRMIQTNLREIDMADMDAKHFAGELKDYNATVVTLNAAGILASYDTKLPYQKKSEYLTGDTLKQMVNECHKAGIKVIARCDFSKIPEEIFEQHPDWAYRRADGNVVNYNGFVTTCVNSEYQQKFVLDILRELFKDHDFDGVFCNMSGFMIVDYDYNYHGPCHCENCKRLFKEQYGLEIPINDDRRNPAYGKYNVFKNQSTARQKRALYEAVKAINPAIAVNGFDYSRIESNQDMDRPTTVYQASTNARKTSGMDKSKVCDGASTDFLGFRYRHTSISSPLMEMRQWQNLANAGSTSLYVMGTLGNHKDQSGIRASRKAFDFFAQHEDVFKGIKSAAEVLLVNKMLLARVDAEVTGWIRALTECHIPFDEAKSTEITPDMLQNKKLVILADTRFISDETAAMFDSYVENGGILLATGESGCNAMNFAPRKVQALKCLGIGNIAEKRKGLKSSIFEIRPEDEATLGFSAEKALGYIVPGEEVVVGDILDESKTETLLSLIPEQLYGPPEVCYPKEKTGIPGIYRTSYGKGLGVFVPWFVGTFYYEQGYENTFTIMKDLLINVCGAASIAPALTPMCEITFMENENTYIIQLVNTSGCFGNSFFEPLTISGIELEVPDGAKAGAVKALNGGNAEVKDGRIVLDKLQSYEALVLSKE